MHWLRVCDDTSTARAEVVIAVVDASEGRLHTGILHCDGESPPTVLHLAFHALLRNERVSAASLTYYGIPLVADERKIAVLCALCRRIYRRWAQSGLPYGIRIGAQITVAGDYWLPPGTSGFTCATFVGRVVERSGLPLVAWDTWRARPGDDEWFSWILSLLEQKAPTDHVGRVKAERECARFRPEDLVSAAKVAADFGGGPFGFEVISPLGARVRNSLLSNS